MYLLKALIDGPCTGVKRKAMSFKQMHLTKFVIKFPHGARSGTVRKAWEKAEVDKQWAETTWAKKIANREMVCIFIIVFVMLICCLCFPCNIFSVIQQVGPVFPEVC